MTATISTSPVYLLQPPANLSGKSPCLDDQQYGLGLLALASWLEAQGLTVEARHFPLELTAGRALTELLDEITDSSPLLVAIGLNWVHFSQGAIGVAKALKQRQQDLPIVLGGQHVSLFAEEVAQQFAGDIDAVIVGEAEVPLLECCRALSAGRGLHPGIPGLCIAGSQPSPPSVVSQIDDLPTYSYRTMAPTEGPSPVAGALSTTRGACPRNCAYCVEPVIGRIQGRERVEHHSPERLVEQLRRFISEGIRRVTIQDGFFLQGDHGIIQLAEAIRDAGLNLEHFNVFAHPDSYSELGLAALASCAERTSVDFGVETGSNKVAKLVGRSLRKSTFLATLDAAADLGVHAYTWWLVGLPGEDDKTIAETKAFLSETMRAGAVPRWVSPLILLPKTPMHEAAPRYGVTPRFRTFADYSRFSDTSLAEALLFTDLITHSTATSDHDTLRFRAADLRRYVLDEFSLLTAFWAERGSRAPDLCEARQRIAASFF